MAIPASAKGTVVATVQTTMERGRLRFFAEAIGQTDPMFTDAASARAAGYPDIVVPPTFLFGVRLETADPFAWLTDLGIDVRFVLHGTQKFSYDALAFAGDTLALTARITDIFEKKQGALEFVVCESRITRDGDPIATLTETLVIRHPELEVA